MAENNLWPKMGISEFRVTPRLAAAHVRLQSRQFCRLKTRLGIWGGVVGLIDTECNVPLPGCVCSGMSVAPVPAIRTTTYLSGSAMWATSVPIGFRRGNRGSPEKFAGQLKVDLLCGCMANRRRQRPLSGEPRHDQRLGLQQASFR